MHLKYFQSKKETMVTLKFLIKFIGALHICSNLVCADLSFTYSWLGNTFKGEGENGKGEWVPMFIRELNVGENGEVLISGHSEAGNELGIWNANGRLENENIPKLPDNHPGRGCWGWGTDNMGADFDNKYIYTATKCNHLVQFERSPPYKYVNSVSFSGIIDAVTVKNKELYLGWVDGRVEIRNSDNLETIKKFSLKEWVKDIAVDSKGFIWVITGTTIKKVNRDGIDQNQTITSVVNPTSLSMSNKGELIVCEDGPDKQVLFFDISGEPKLSKTFGVKGGLYSGNPGEMKPEKLFNLAGAETDKNGNLFVACSKQEAVLRKYSSSGNLLWEIMSCFYIDNLSVDPSSDGKFVYGSDEIFEMDYSKSPGKEATLKALSYNPVRYPNDTRNFGGSHDTGSIMKTYPTFCWIRNIQGKKLQFMQGQYAGDIQIHLFESEYISKFIKTIKVNGWANYVDSRGNIWCNGEGNKIVMHRFVGFQNDSQVQYALNDKIYSMPPQFTDNVIQRLRFLPESESKIPGGVMYLSGYTKDKPSKDWGLIGSRLARFDGWENGNITTSKWVMNTPTDGEGFYPKDCDVAGDHVFMVSTRPTKNHDQYVWVYDAASGAYVGDMYPAVQSGWTDMPNSVSAFKRSDGLYIIFVEEDFRGKVNMYRWCPSGLCSTTSNISPSINFLQSQNTSTDLSPLKWQINGKSQILKKNSHSIDPSPLYNRKPETGHNRPTD